MSVAEKVLRLFHDCGYPNHSMKTWEWWQQQGLFWSATEHCFYAAVPRMLRYQGEAIPAAFGVQLVSHPEHRSLTELSRVIRSVEEQAEQRGIHVLYGIPNHISRPILERLFGWRQLYACATLAMPLSGWDGPGGAPLVPLEFSQGPPVPAGLIAMQKDAAYLTWRYTDHPTTAYAKVQDSTGFVVVKVYDAPSTRYGHILEWGAEGEITGLLRGAAQWFAGQGVTTVSTWLHPQHPLYAALMQAGFRATGPDIKLMGKVLRGTREVPWHLVMGDSDAY